MNEFFIYLEDITVNPGYLKEWRIIQMTALALGPNTPSKQAQFTMYLDTSTGKAVS